MARTGTAETRQGLENQIRQVVVSGSTRPDMRPGESLGDYLVRLDAWKEQGPWVPAAGGTEQPFVSRSGTRLLYCYQPRSGRHAYLNLDTDLVLTDEEARLHLGT